MLYELLKPVVGVAIFANPFVAGFLHTTGRMTANDNSKQPEHGNGG